MNQYVLPRQHRSHALFVEYVWWLSGSVLWGHRHWWRVLSRLVSRWQLIRGSGSWNTPPSPAGHGAACLLYLTSQPESWGPVRLWGRASAEKRTEEKERSNYVQSLSSEDPPPPTPPQVHYRGPALATKRRPFGAKGAGMFWRNMTPPDPSSGKRSKIKKPTPPAFGLRCREV